MISILIATYNSQTTIRACLDSLLRQLYQDWECIICDGVSEDDTIKIVEEYEKKDSRFRHNIKKDSGIYDALNNGIKIANGKWLYVLGADDRIHPEAFFNFDLDKNENYDVIYGNIIDVYANGTHRLIKPMPLSKIIYLMPFGHQGAIVKTKLAQDIGGFDIQYKVRGDYNMMLTLYMKGCSFLYIDIPVAYFSLLGYSNSSVLKYESERLRITRSHHSNKCPLFFHYVIIIRKILIYLRDKLCGRHQYK